MRLKGEEEERNGLKTKTSVQLQLAKVCFLAQVLMQAVQFCSFLPA